MRKIKLYEAEMLVKEMVFDLEYSLTNKEKKLREIIQDIGVNTILNNKFESIGYKINDFTEEQLETVLTDENTTVDKDSEDYTILIIDFE